MQYSIRIPDTYWNDLYTSSLNNQYLAQFLALNDNFSWLDYTISINISEMIDLAYEWLSEHLMILGIDLADKYPDPRYGMSEFDITVETMIEPYVDFHNKIYMYLRNIIPEFDNAKVKEVKRVSKNWVIMEY